MKEGCQGNYYCKIIVLAQIFLIDRALMGFCLVSAANGVKSDHCTSLCRRNDQQYRCRYD